MEKFKPSAEWGMSYVSNQHKATESKRVSLLTYWTWRYVLVLLSVLLLIGICTGLWIRQTAYEQGFELLELRANQAVEAYEITDGNPKFDKSRLKDMRLGKFLIQVVDEQNHTRIVLRGSLQERQESLPVSYELVERVRNGDTVREKFNSEPQTWLIVGVPISQPDHPTEVLILGLPAEDALPYNTVQYGLLSLLILTTALVGFLFLYLLSRKLTGPLLQVTTAAQRISEGHYDQLELPEQVKEQELHLLVGTFQNMAARLSHLEQLRTDLLAGVSHELRTPITSIRGMVQAVHDRVVTDEEAEEFLHISLKETQRLQEMVENLLNLTSFEAGTVPLEKKTVDLVELIDEVIHQLRVLPDFATVNFVVHTPAHELETYGDPNLLRQILINLFNNSREASSAQASITVRTEIIEGLVRLDVQDEGRGIPQEDQPYIFERFYRGKTGRKKSHGLGLGLTISKLLARAHGGDLVLHKSTPAGTTFRLSLPLGTTDTPATTST